MVKGVESTDSNKTIILSNLVNITLLFDQFVGGPSVYNIFLKNGKFIV
jgi:hypothetical protein